MSLLKLSKKELKEIASDSDVWSIYIRMKEMLEGIKGIDLKEEWNTTDRFNQIPTGFVLGAKYTFSSGETGKVTLSQAGVAPPNISTHVNLVVQLAKLTNNTIKEINKEGYFSNKKLIKKLDKVVYLGCEYLKAYKEAYSGVPPIRLDDAILSLKWTPNANLRVLSMLNAAKKMEKALEGIKEHLVIEPFKKETVDGKPSFGMTFGRISESIEFSTSNPDISLIAKLIILPIKTYLDTECPDLPEADKDRILQSRMSVLALIQIKPSEDEAFKAVNEAVLAVMQA